MNDQQRHIQPILTAGLDVSGRPTNGPHCRPSLGAPRMAPAAVTAPVHFENQPQAVEGEVGVVAPNGRLLPERYLQLAEQSGESLFVLAYPEPAIFSRSGAP